jgi:tetratricopeptide (TPR) repeat protein
VLNVAIGLLGALLTVNPPATDTNQAATTNGAVVVAPAADDPVEKEFKQLEIDDDDALAEVDKWTTENRAAAAQGGGVPNDVLNNRILARLATVRKSYEDFLSRHPDHVRAHLAFGGFLDDIKDMDGSRAQLEKALELDPKNPAAWNNLANHYSHTGPVDKMFEFYGKAMELNPAEPTYYVNLADSMFVFRTNAIAYFHLKDEQEVFNKTLDLYQRAFKLDPTNFLLATELAQNYYGIKPTRTDDALAAWTNALNIASTDLEKQGVYVHLARFKLNAGRFAEAHADLEHVNLEPLADLKNRLLHNLTEREKPPKAPEPPARMQCPSRRFCQAAAPPNDTMRQPGPNTTRNIWFPLPIGWGEG